MGEPFIDENAPAAPPGPRYAAIERQLTEAIKSRLLAPGIVVTEDPLARLFGTSRTPVRQAFTKLEDSGLLERFEGRGFVVTGAEEPLRIHVTREMLGLGTATTTQPPQMASERIAQDFEASIAQALPFGQYRVHEQAAADHFAVSRTIVRELLSRFQDRGLVRKSVRSHWVVGPLTAQDIAHYFAIRAQLEPLAMADSAPLMSPSAIGELHEATIAALDGGDNLSPEEIETLETDLHVRLLARSPNPHLLRMLHQSQVALAVNQVFARTVGTRPFHTALTEHRIVYEFLMRGSWKAASDALQEHLRLSAARTRQRLMSFSVFAAPELPEYLRPIPA